MFDKFLARGSRSGGYTRLPNFLLRRAKDLGLDRSSLLVLLVLISLRRGDVACVSVKRIATDSMLSERAVKKCIKRMEATLGLLPVERDAYRFRFRKSNRYDLGLLVMRMEEALRKKPWRKHAPPAVERVPLHLLLDAEAADA